MSTMAPATSISVPNHTRRGLYSRQITSPLPIPRETPSDFDVEDEDEDNDDELLVETVPLDLVIPCSSPLQPTQLLPPTSPSVKPSQTSTISSPARKLAIEVPCSSPPQLSIKPTKPLPTRQGMISQFFNTSAAPVPAVGNKRAFDLIQVSDDDSSDENRANIRRTKFEAVKKPEATSPVLKKKKVGMGKLDLASYKYSPPSPKSGTVSAFSDVADNSVKRNAIVPAFRDYTPDESSPEKSRPRRRLVRGLRSRLDSQSPKRLQETPAQTPPPPVTAPAPKKKLVKQKPLVISDDEDELNNDEAFVSRESSPEITRSGNKIVDMLNAIEMGDLAALTGDREDVLSYLLSKRPFRSIAQIQSICKHRTVRGKKQDVNIGEAIIDKVSSFTRAINAVDKIVIESDRRADIIKQEIDSWGVNNIGVAKKSSVKTRSGRFWKAGQPANMNAELPMHDYQIFGVNWMNLLSRKGFGGILADDMGLGKTCQVIGLMCRMVQDYEAERPEQMPFPNLIVVPPSTLDNWLAEFERFAPHLSIVKYSGTQDVRNEIVDELDNQDEVPHVILTSYTQLSTNVDVQNMNRLGTQNAIFDEGQVLKNPTTKQYQRLARLKVKWRLLLSGTPIQNHLMEMISLLNFVDPNLFAREMEHIQYVFDHKIHSKNLSNTALLYGERVSRARSILEPFILQRLKDQVGQNLPKKIQRIVHCDLPPKQRELYDKYEQLFRAEGGPKPNSRKSGVRENDMNNIWIQLKKAALHPQLFRQHFTDKMVHDMAKTLYNKVDHRELDLAESKFELLHNDLRGRSDFDLHLYCADFPKYLQSYDIKVDSWKESGKVQKLLAMIEEYKANGDRVLVFSKFSMVIDILSYILHCEEISHCQLTGASAVGDRQAEINRFQNDKSIPVFLLTTGAGGTGINLTAANKVVIFDMSSNPQDDKQAENRAHRLGQTREVEVIHLIAKDTVEELIYLTCQKKIELADKVITGGAGSGGEKSEGASEAQLKEVVRGLMDKRLSAPEGVEMEE